MSDPFAAALEAIHGSVLGATADYTLASGGPPFPVRIVLSVPEGSAFGGLSASAEAEITRAAMGDHGRPTRNDTLTLADGRAFTVQEVDADVMGLSYKLRLSVV